MPAGRPRKYETVEELDEVIVDFFRDCKENNNIPTVTGLCISVGMTRQSLINYECRPEYLDTIKNAKLAVEYAIEQRLMEGGNPAGAIFNLKNNFGWIDEKKVDQNVKGEMNVRSVTIAGLDPTDA